MLKKKKVNITPSPRLMDIIGATSFTVANAISEIVANSLDAAAEGVKPDIKISIDQEKGEIVIVDNGVGLKEEILEDALAPAEDMGQKAYGGKARKGHFGLGMKTACASLGHWWGVYTRPIGGNQEHRVFFDLKDWAKRTRDSKSWDVDIETHDPDKKSFLQDAQHGTAIVIKQLRQRGIITGAVIEKLGEAFKAHIEQGDSITVDGIPIKPRGYRFIRGSKVPIDLKVGPGGKLHITGWVGIDERTHNDGNFGFNIYRMRQLLQPWNQDWFRSHLMTSRIIGEVHLDFIDANFFKMGVQVQSDEWGLVSREMHEFLKPVVKASYEISRGPRSDAKNLKAINDMRVKLGLKPCDVGVGSQEDGESGPEGGGDGGGGTEEGGTSEGGIGGDPHPQAVLKVTLEQLNLEDGTEIKLRGVEESLDGEKTPWDFLFEEDANEVKAVLNTNSELYKNAKYPNDRVALMRFAIADAIVGFLIEWRHLPLNKARNYRNEWLYQAITKTAAVAGGGK